MRDGLRLPAVGPERDATTEPMTAGGAMAGSGRDMGACGASAADPVATPAD